MTLRLNGATSGSVSLDAPASGADVALELPTDSIKPGMVLIASQSFSAASSVSVNNCFTATYENYAVTLLLTTSTSAYPTYRLRASGTDATTNYNRQSSWGIGTSTQSGAESSASSWLIEGNQFSGDSVAHLTFFRPSMAAPTFVLGLNYGVAQNVAMTGGRHSTASAYDGLTIAPNTGTITGSIRVYGYRNNL